jgi:leucine dehydrogenase
MDEAGPHLMAGKLYSRTGKTKEKNTMESLIREWEGESVITRFDRESEALIFIAIHSTRLGPAIGGTRMKPYPDARAALLDAMRLAGGMTHKWAAAGIDSGGGKAVIAVPPDLDSTARTELLRRYGAFIKQLGGLFLTGPDVGTGSEDMDTIAEAGDPYVFCRTPQAGGTGNPAPFTALGVFTAIQAAAERVFGNASLKGKRVLVQGAGSVGRQLIQRLTEVGSEVLFSDVNETCIGHFRDDMGLECVPADAVYDTPCDIFAPSALGGVLDETTIPRLGCRIVAGAANNQLAGPEDGMRLRERDILYAPDFISNSGGAIAAVGMEIRGWSREEAEEKVVQSVKDNLKLVFELAATEGCSTDEAARRLAERRLTGTE